LAVDGTDPFGQEAVAAQAVVDCFGQIRLIVDDQNSVHTRSI